MLALNAKLPPGFKIEPLVKKEPQPFKNSLRRSEAENLDADFRYVPLYIGKRTIRDKPLQNFEEVDHHPRQCEGYRKANTILQALKKHANAGPFLEPVNSEAVPGYSSVVEQPMDLATVEQKLRAGVYTSAYQFALDVRLIWYNSFLYNTGGSELHEMTLEMSSLFEKHFRGVEQLFLTEKVSTVQDLVRRIAKLSKTCGPLRMNKPEPKHDRPMTIQEKRTLCSSIQALESKHLSGLLDIVRGNTNMQGQQLEFDIEKLPPQTCWELDAYVKKCDLQTVERSMRPEAVSKLMDLEKQLNSIAQPVEDSSSDSDSEGDMPGPPVRPHTPEVQTGEANLLKSDEEFVTSGFMDFGSPDDVFS